MEIDEVVIDAEPADGEVDVCVANHVAIEVVSIVIAGDCAVVIANDVAAVVIVGGVVVMMAMR